MTYGLVFLANSIISSQKQRDEIGHYATKHNINIDKFVSHKKTPNINMLQPGDSVVLYAWNCISADKKWLNNFIRYLLQNNICLYSVTSPYCVDKTKDFKQFECAFNLYEDIRFNFQSNKCRNGIKNRIARGQEVGRHKGTRNARRVLDGKEKTIWDMYSSGASMCAIAKKLKVSAPTIRRFLDARN